MLPCLRTGLDSLLFCNTLRAFTIIILVSIGSITISIIPFSAAMYGFANFSRYSFASFFLISIGFFELFEILSVYDCYCSLQDPEQQFLLWARHNSCQLLKIFTPHCNVGPTISLAYNTSYLWNCCITVGIEQLAAVSNYTIVLLICSW